MANEVIDKFEGEYKFLSNFWRNTPVDFEGITYPTVEHAYQAAKTLDLELRKEICAESGPGKAKFAGRRVKLRPDWEDIKVEVMLGLLRQKFAKGTMLADMLDATGDKYLEEGNWWGDTFWGVCKGRGQNWLGTLLMQVRMNNRA